MIKHKSNSKILNNRSFNNTDRFISFDDNHQSHASIFFIVAEHTYAL